MAVLNTEVLNFNLSGPEPRPRGSDKRMMVRVLASRNVILIMFVRT